MERELRRYQNLLVCVGTGVIAFGIWSILKSVMMLTRDRRGILEYLGELMGEEYARLGMDLLYLLVGVILAIDLLIRLYVGVTARKDGMGTRKGKHRVYLVFALILAVVIFLNMVGNFRGLGDLEAVAAQVQSDDLINYFINTVLDIVVAFIVDITSLIMTVEMFVAGFRVRSLEKKIQAGQPGEGVS